MSQYGHFSKEGDEFIITRPDTSKPWINYLTNGTYCALVSQTGGGYSFVGDAGYNRILEEHPSEELISDRPGRYVYIRDNDTGEFWGLTWQPTCHEIDYFETRHGLGYTKVTSQTHEIKGEITYFVPLEDTCELWKVNLINNSKKDRHLSIFVYAEWSLGNHQANLEEPGFNDLFNDMEYEDGVIYAMKRRWVRPDTIASPWDKVAFITINQKVDGFDCFKEKFTGMYGFIGSPKVVKEGQCQSSVGDGHHSIGALQKNVTLTPHENFNFDVILGTEQKADGDITKTSPQKKYNFHIDKRIINKFQDHEQVEIALDNVKKHWQAYVKSVIVKTPDPDFDISVNYWNKYQAWITTQWSLMDSYYVGGSATYGFRDMCQHLLGTLPNDLEFSKERTKLLLSYQFYEGKTVHNWDALLKKGLVTDHSDDPQWLVMAVLNYVNESGDTSFLEEMVPYYDTGKGKVLEHIVRAIDHTIHHSSDRGIPHRRTADWNDALTGGKEGKGESAMVANQLVYNLQILIPILKTINEEELFRKYSRVSRKIKEVLNRDFWDGSWYIRATDDKKRPIGSKKNTFAKIDINGQTWPIISGVADEKRGKICMDAVWKKLMTEYGPVMFAPPFEQPSPEYGIISQFIPGTKENGAIFNHPVSWAVIAECLLGRGDKAFEIWRRTSFMTRGKNPNLYRAEPYVYAEFVYGPMHPEFGRGSFTWATGSASWFWRACLDYICGIRPTLDGLLIDPCIPKDWPQFEVKRKFRGADYHIKVKNPSKVSKGVREIIVDGQKLDNPVVPTFSNGHHLVEVMMGTPAIKASEEPQAKKQRLVNSFLDPHGTIK